jgi:hypothetical protein
MMSKPTTSVWLLALETKHGTDTYAFSTEEKGKQALREYVAEEVEKLEEEDKEGVPTDPDELVAWWFDDVGTFREWYDLEEHVIDDEERPIQTS